MPSKPRRFPSTSQAGFTLMELVITTVILAILTAWAMPNFRDFMRRNNVTSQANNVLADLQNARTEAINQRKLVSICPKSSTSTDADTTCVVGSTNYDGGWLAYTTIGAGTAYAAGTSGYDLLHAGAGSPSVSIRSDQGVFTFNSRGELSDQLQHVINVCFKSTSGQAGAGSSTATVQGKTIIISPTGRAIVQDLAVGGACAPGTT
ncbi:GspH/FimT family pseudopilin [Dyella sp.]|uniref:GspH/FimT family pseudopilin n=1 Tax=Dyella sp. TaxID=1869338 RepID=UPI002ED59B0A